MKRGLFTADDLVTLRAEISEGILDDEFVLLRTVTMFDLLDTLDAMRAQIEALGGQWAPITEHTAETVGTIVTEMEREGVAG